MWIYSTDVERTIAFYRESLVDEVRMGPSHRTTHND
jgi:hypothetical protein